MMAKTSQRQQRWERRKKRVQKQMARSERPLLTMYRSDRHIYAQIVDPVSGRTITGASTLSASVREGLRSTKSKAAAAKVGQEIARLAREQQIEAVSFNRNGFVFAGRVKALADAAREAGLRI
jgi:large subunit ribosomal protein L18